MTLYLAIFLTIALVISNPLRSPVVIVFIVFAFWRLAAERRSILARAVPEGAQRRVGNACVPVQAG
jgi:hypothetical protein